uniref:Uncharacterized protein n=1 Tax=Cucumis sativus TaxID=3659 RepID=A0A0A0KJC0_CUCSA
MLCFSVKKNRKLNNKLWVVYLKFSSMKEEAEVCSDATISRDEDDMITSLFDIFIDDRVNASAPSPQDETCRPDM